MSRASWKRLLPAAIAALAAWGLYRWPARRNYYGKRGEVDFRLDVPYAGDTDPKRQLDLYLPLRRNRSEAFPLLVFVHGGYAKPLDRRWLQPLLGVHGNIGVALARQGVGAAIISYRQYPRIRKGDESLDDITAAIRYVRDAAPSWGGDGKRIFVMGHSAGGHLASLLAMSPRLLESKGIAAGDVAGFISLDGVFDLVETIKQLPRDEAAIVADLFGPDATSLATYSPISFARAEHPPLLFVDSTDDAPLCREEFMRMRARMREAGSGARFIELPGLGHDEMTYRMGMDGDLVTPLVLEFIRSISPRGT
jgi:acetyl esterase/lipase